MVDRDLDDVEFVAAALGAIDGTISAFGSRPDQVEMLTMGSTFALKQIKDLERLQDAKPGEIGDLIGKAMTSENLEEIRAQAGHLAYTANKTPTR